MKDQLESLVAQLVDRGILFGDAVAEFEKRFIKKVLENHHGNQSRAARAPDRAGWESSRGCFTGGGSEDCG
ncbi:MAG: hypothetical protein L0212_12950, partial [Acidobacteria bacterium]|nr:hypothetical protein [Acidobacteriota bacterium]